MEASDDKWNLLWDFKRKQNTCSILKEKKYTYLQSSTLLFYNLNKTGSVGNWNISRRTPAWKWDFSHFGIASLKKSENRFTEQIKWGAKNQRYDFSYNDPLNNSIFQVEIKKKWHNRNQKVHNYLPGQLLDIDTLIDQEESKYKYAYEQLYYNCKDILQASEEYWFKKKEISEEEILKTLSNLAISDEVMRKLQVCVDVLNSSRRLITFLQKKRKFVISKLLKLFRNLRIIFNRHHSFHFKNLDDYHDTLIGTSLYIKV